MDLLLYIGVVYSTSNIIAHSGIFSFFRDWLENTFGEESKLYELFTCMMCLPTWVGFFFSTIFILLGYYDLSPFYSKGIDLIPLAIFLDGVLSSATTWLIHTFQEYLESNSD